MRDIQQVQLMHSPELAASIDELDIGVGQQLIDVQDIGGIESLKTVASVVDGPNNDETAFISTSIKTRDSVVETDEISACLRSNIIHGMEIGSISALGPEHIGEEIVKLASASDDTETFIVGSPPDSWLIRSSVVLPEREEIDESTRIPNLVEEHVFITNVLLAALAGRHIDADHDEITAHHLFLSVKPLLELPSPVKEDPFERYVGIDDIISRLQRFVKLANSPHSMLAEHEVSIDQAILLQGPSGVGKTELVASLATALGAEKRPIRFGDISGAHVGEWAKNIQQKFDAAIKDASEHGRRILIHFDEADGLLTPGNDGTAKNISSVLKDCLDRVKDHPNVFVAFTANPNEVLDPNVFNDKRVPLRIDIPRSSEETLRDVLGEITMQNTLNAVNSPSVDLEVAVNHFESDIDIEMIARLLHEKEFTAGDLIEVVSNIRKNHLLDQQLKGVESPKPVILTQAKLLDEIANAEKRRSGIKREK